MLKAKGFKPKLNIMDNQATKHIKKFLTENKCKLQLVEPHNHQTSNPDNQGHIHLCIGNDGQQFPLQLWD